MRRVLLFFCTINTLGLTVSAQSNADLGVGAIGLVVSDIEASETFYKDVLGMVEAGGFSLDEQWSEEAGAANNRPFIVKMFKTKNLPSATILKLAYFEQTGKQAERSGINTVSGVNYITFHYTAEEFQELITRLDKAGIEKTGWVKRDTYQLFFVRDPDGLFVEFVGPPDN